MEVGQADATFVVRGYFPDVVAEAAQGFDPVGRDDLATAPDARAATHDPAVRHERSGNHRVLADMEDLAYLRPALDDFDHLGLQQALQRRVDVVGELVDDVVQPDVDSLGLGRSTGRVGDL